MSLISGTTRVFGRLRVRLTLMFALTGLAGFLGLVAVLSARDMTADNARVDAILVGEASRAAGMVYADDAGRLMVDAVAGDRVRRQATGRMIVDLHDGSPRVLLADGVPLQGDWVSLARACVTEHPEDGVTASLGSMRVAGVAWRGVFTEPEPRGCALTYLPAESLLGADITAPAIVGSLLLLGLLSGIVWWSSGRSLTVAETALADRERFLATAAHEMRGPLARMRAVSEDALGQVSPEEPVAERLRRLVATADQAGRVVSNLLLASRIDHAEVPVQSAPVRLDGLAGDIEIQVDGVVVDVLEPVEIRGDAMLLRQALLNLVDNAVRHGATGHEHHGVLITVRRDPATDTALVRVSDDGPGFPPGLDAARPYASGSTGGNGLGLPLVQWIVHRHGGTLAWGPADGADGYHGAAVELRLPL